MRNQENNAPASHDGFGVQAFPGEGGGDRILRTGLQLPEQIANRLDANYSTVFTESMRVFFDRTALERTAPADPIEAAEREAEELHIQLQRIDDALELESPDGSLIAAIATRDGGGVRLDEAYRSAFDLMDRGSVFAGMEIARIEQSRGDLVLSARGEGGADLTIILRAASPAQVEAFESIGDPEMPIDNALKVTGDVWDASSRIPLDRPRPEFVVGAPTDRGRPARTGSPRLGRRP